MRKGENALGLEVQSQLHRRVGVGSVLKEGKVFVHIELRGQGLARWRAQRQERNSGGTAGERVLWVASVSVCLEKCFPNVRINQDSFGVMRLVSRHEEFKKSNSLETIRMHCIQQN